MNVWPVLVSFAVDKVTSVPNAILQPFHTGPAFSSLVSFVFISENSLSGGIAHSFSDYFSFSIFLPNHLAPPQIVEWRADLLQKKLNLVWKSYFLAKLILVVGLNPTEGSNGQGLPAGTPRWIKGELINRGVSGKLYIVLKLIPGAIVTVKQAQVPKSPADENYRKRKDTMKASVSEWNILRGISHPKILILKSEGYLNM